MVTNVGAVSVKMDTLKSFSLGATALVGKMCSIGGEEVGGR